jgi:hypothetical protein
MDVIGFLCLLLCSSTVQLYDSLVADAHEHVQRLVSVVKMTTALEECNTEEQRSVVLLLWRKRLNTKDIHK